MSLLLMEIAERIAEKYAADHRSPAPEYCTQRLNTKMYIFYCYY